MIYEWVPLAALILSGVSIIFTALKFYLDWRDNRMRISFDIDRFFNLDNKRVLSITLSNKTKNPIAITKIEFKGNNQHGYARFKEHIISPAIKTRASITSIGFPLNLNSYEAKSGLIILDAEKSIINNDFKVILYSNKGKKSFQCHSQKLFESSISDEIVSNRNLK